MQYSLKCYAKYVNYNNQMNVELLRIVSYVLYFSYQNLGPEYEDIFNMSLQWIFENGKDVGIR